MISLMLELLKNLHFQKKLAVRFTSEATTSFTYKKYKKAAKYRKTCFLLTYHSRNVKFNKELSLYSNHFKQKIMANSTSASSAQGHFIKILSEGSHHFYDFDSKLSPKDFLNCKGIISKLSVLDLFGPLFEWTVFVHQAEKDFQTRWHLKELSKNSE